MKNIEAADVQWKKKLHVIIYESDTFKGKLFDVILLIVILISILAVILESINSIDLKFHKLFKITEWVITLFFTLEYILRIIVVKKPKNYIFSTLGIIDLISTLPMYLSLFWINAHSLLAIRALRLLRVFRVLKLSQFVGESEMLSKALRASSHKIFVFLIVVITLVILLGTTMYIIEGDVNKGYNNIPKSIYWAIVTMTTVGYGDITPITPLGQFLASVIMILGYGIIAVPTGIVTSEMTKQSKVDINTQVCRNCNENNHQDSAKFCFKCGEKLD
jgi:voltage-gated potassium channel